MRINPEGWTEETYQRYLEERRAKIESFANRDHFKPGLCCPPRKTHLRHRTSVRDDAVKGFIRDVPAIEGPETVRLLYRQFNREQPKALWDRCYRAYIRNRSRMHARQFSSGIALRKTWTQFVQCLVNKIEKEKRNEKSSNSTTPPARS